MYLLDTDIIIYFLKGIPAVVRNVESHAADPKALSVVTYGELVFGAMKSSRPVENMAKVRRVAELFPVIDASRAILQTFGTIKAGLEKRGRSTDDFELVIAATALGLNYRVATNNEKHFRDTQGLSVKNWATA
jgi:tRNA(fMet)-specific endonuclease VapC